MNRSYARAVRRESNLRSIKHQSSSEKSEDMEQSERCMVAKGDDAGVRKQRMSVWSLEIQQMAVHKSPLQRSIRRTRLVAT